jgi:hypothetical protein
MLPSAACFNSTWPDVAAGEIDLPPTLMLLPSVVIATVPSGAAVVAAGVFAGEITVPPSAANAIAGTITAAAAAVANAITNLFFFMSFLLFVHVVRVNSLTIPILANNFKEEGSSNVKIFQNPGN